ncbi:dihydrofolate reductase family protein [Frankia sp. Cas3]|uniref:dihydrofolate reductase family protein n=1 Tax=Frankia sp. Cas3 TaxID=3073926 RepID=UPI002AD21DE2|nr:dihydrofolate reductase family protein [Frankia sp. Cas3]
MTKLRVHNFSISLDGYAAGQAQSVDNPLGVGGHGLHEWVFATRTGAQMIGMDGGDEGVDDRFVARGDVGIGATVMGRNMFGPIRGPWGENEWTGWWGDNPPFHHPVFVLTHHARPSITMQGGTTFHFVDDSIDTVLERAREAADGQDVRLGGGVATIQQYLRAGLIDDLHLVIVPILLHRGERLFDHLDGDSEGYQCVEFVTSSSVAHVHLSRTPPLPPATPDPSIQAQTAGPDG